MKAFKTLLLVAAMCLTLGSFAIANDLYDNGPINGNTDAWTINFGYAVSDTFTVSDYYTPITGVSFAAWLFPGDTLTSAEVSITSQEFGGTTYFDQLVNFTQGSCFGNNFGYNVCEESGAINVTVNPGTYWLTLQNATVASGNPVYWDENSGPSLASESSLGTIPSEAFTVFGGNITCGGNGMNCGPPSPEPTSLLLFATGGLALLGVLRRRLF